MKRDRAVSKDEARILRTRVAELEAKLRRIVECADLDGSLRGDLGVAVEFARDEFPDLKGG
jgi:hypothetical protein